MHSALLLSPSPIISCVSLESIYLGRVNALSFKNSSLSVRTHNVMLLSLDVALIMITSFPCNHTSLT